MAETVVSHRQQQPVHAIVAVRTGRYRFLRPLDGLVELANPVQGERKRGAELPVRRKRPMIVADGLLRQLHRPGPVSTELILVALLLLQFVVLLEAIAGMLAVVVQR